MDALNTKAPPPKAFPFVPWISPSQQPGDSEKARSRRLVRSHAARQRACCLDNVFNIPIKNTPQAPHDPFREARNPGTSLPAVRSLYPSREPPEIASNEDTESHRDGPNLPNKSRRLIKASPEQLIPNVRGTQPAGLGYIAIERMDPFRTSPLGNLPQGTLDECLRYSVSVLWPNLLPGSRENATVQAWSHFHIVEEAACFALSLGALCHKQTNNFITDGDDPLVKRRLLYLEMEAARTVNQALENPCRPITDSLILSSLCMANNSSREPVMPNENVSPFRAPLRELQWLNIYAMNTSNVAHQAGLYHLIQLRGGLNSIKLPGLAAIISYSDILAASKSLSQPRFPFFSLRCNHKFTMHEMFDLRQTVIEDAHTQNRELGFSPKLTELFEGIRSYVHILERIEKHQSPFQHGIQLAKVADQRNFIQHSALCLHPGVQIPGHYPERLFLYDACRIAALIFCFGVVFPLPYETSPLPLLATLLKAELEKITWPVFESARENEALLWVAVMGGIAATGTGERRWFVASLQDLVRKNHIHGWSQLKMVMKSMLWLDSACDRAARDVWDEVGFALEP